MPIKAALLDIDGTLVDSNRLHAQAWAETLQDSGIKVEWASIEPLIGMGGDQLLPRLAGVNKESDRGKEIGKARQEIFLKKYLPQVKPFPGAWEFVRFLKKDLGLKTVLATSANEEELKALIDQADFHNLFDDQVTGTDVRHSKPYPDVVLAALKKAGVKPEEAIMIGDTPYDLRAAQAAGVRMAALGFGRRKAEEFPGAWRYATDLANLKSILEQASRDAL